MPARGRRARIRARRAEQLCAGRPVRAGPGGRRMGGGARVFGGVDALTAPAATLHRLSLPAADASASAKCAACLPAPM